MDVDCPHCPDGGDVEILAGGDDVICWTCNRTLKRAGRWE